MLWYNRDMSDESHMKMNLKIVSGGQMGVDQGGMSARRNGA